MTYNFYHNLDINVEPINKDYCWIKDQFNLYELLCKCWNKDTCAPRLRDKWNVENITCGQCSITAFLVQDIFGGDVYGVLTKSGMHCFNVIRDVIFDLTSEQFSGNDTIKKYTLDNLQFRENHFIDTEKFDRYLKLKERLNQLKQ